jgi:hypothetical protein
MFGFMPEFAAYFDEIIVEIEGKDGKESSVSSDAQQLVRAASMLPTVWWTP